MATNPINGRLSDSMLAPIGGGQRLQPQAANAYLQMQAAAAADGVHWFVTDSYRTYAEQVDLAKRKGLYSEGGLAAQPGTSNHGLGLAVDLGDTATKPLTATELTWLQRNAARFGFSTIPREAWHWEYASGSASTSNGGRALANPLVAGDFQVTDADIPSIQATIRHQESSNDYTESSHPAPGASGAYQVEDATWNNYMGYARAYLAPPAVQDQWAASKISAIISANNGSAAAIPITWYYPAALKNPALLDSTPAGNKVSIRKYTTDWLAVLKTTLGNPPGSISGAYGDTNQLVNGSSDCLWSINLPGGSLPVVGSALGQTCLLSRSVGKKILGGFIIGAGGLVLLIGFGFVVAGEVKAPTVASTLKPLPSQGVAA